MKKLSYSALNTFNTCGELYRLKYIEKVPTTENFSSALMFGGAFDSAIEALLLGTGDPYEVFEKTFSLSEFLQKVKICYKSDFFNPPGRLVPGDQEQLRAAWTDLSLKGGQFIREFTDKIIPHIEKVYSAQQKSHVTLSTGLSIPGFLDFYVRYKGKDVLFDLKTASRPYPKNSVKKSKQLATYAAFLDAPNQGYIVFCKDFTNAKERPQVLIDTIDKEFIQECIMEYAAAHRQIEAKQFAANFKACHNQFGSRCPMYEACPARLAREQAEMDTSKGLKSEE